MALAALLAPIIAPIRPDRDADPLPLPPAVAAFPFGTDQFGRDMFYPRALWRAAVAVDRPCGTALISGVFGACLGVLVGAIPQVRRAADAGDGRADGGPGDPAGDRPRRGARARTPPASSSRCRSPTSRAPRASCAARRWSTRELEFIEAARVAGASALRIMLRHICCRMRSGPLLVQSTFVFAYAMLAEAALSFLGVGPSPPTPAGATSSPRAAIIGAGMVDHAVSGHRHQPRRARHELARRRRCATCSTRA